MKLPIVGIDVDDVCLDLMSAWLSVYNALWGDNLTEDKITDWDISKFVKPECGKRIYDLCNYPPLYDKYVMPVKNALETIRELEQKFTIIFVTSSAMLRVVEAKYNRLVKLGFPVSTKNYFVAGDKGLIKADVLIDDCIGNLDSFDNGRNEPICFGRPWNKEYPYQRRASNWLEVKDMLRIMF